MVALSRSALAHRAAAEDARVDATDAELAEPVRYLPTSPWAFLWHFVREGPWRRYAIMVFAVVLAQICQTLDPYILKLLINSFTDALGVVADERIAGPI